MIRNAVLFDLDGVLVNSERLKAEAWKRTLAHYFVLDGDRWYKERIGTARLALAEQAVTTFSLPIDDPSELAKQKVAVYWEILEKRTEPIANSIVLLKRLSADKVPIGIVSSQNRKIILRQLELALISERFSVIVSGEDDVRRKKPYPDVYLLAAKKLAVDPVHCIAIEDTEEGLAAARGAEMTCIGFQNPESGKQNLCAADLVTRNLATTRVYRFVLQALGYAYQQEIGS